MQETNLKGRALKYLVHSGYTPEEYLELMKIYEQNVTLVNQNDVVKGRVVSVADGNVTVDIGYKSEATIPRSEFLSMPDIKAGDEVEVMVEATEDNDGKLKLNRRKVDFLQVWEKVLKLHETQEVVKVTLTRRTKGGLVANLLGIDAFLPGSQVDVRPVRDFDALVGRELDVRVVKINHPNENVVVSHKVLLEEELATQREEMLTKLEKGMVLKGIVKAIADFGIFVDLGGVDGLVHITDLSWGRVNHPSEVVQLDQEIQVVVIEYDKETKRISLGIKQLIAHPWDDIDSKITIGQKVNGKIVSLTDYGAFIEIEKGIEGLIHISEMSWTQHVKHPSQMFNMGQEVECVVLAIDKIEKKISLGIKQLEADPWEILLQKYPIGSIQKAVVKNLANFGVFAELETGVEGLVHISDLSWTKKLRHPGEVVAKGDELEVLILGVDSVQRRIALGHKQVTPNPWEDCVDDFKIGTDMKGTITRIIDKGVVVEIKHGVEGYVPNSQLAFAPVRNVSQFFRIGDILPLKIIEFDAEQRKIILSAVDALRSLPEDEQAAYFVEHPVPQSDSNAKSDILVDLGDAAAPLESEFAFGDLADFKPNYSDSDINTSLKTDDFIETNVINDVPILNEINEAPSVEEISTTLNIEEVIVESQAVVQEVVNSTESEVEVESNTIVAEDSSNNEKNPDIEG